MNVEILIFVRSKEEELKGKLLFGFMAIVVGLGLVIANVGKVQASSDKVTICHYTNVNADHLYNKIDVSINSISSSGDWLNGHGGEQNDIWPAFTAKNGDSIDAHGDQTILANGCTTPPTPTEPPVDTLTPTPPTPTEPPVDTVTPTPPTPVESPTQTLVPPTEVPPTRTALPQITAGAHSASAWPVFGGAFLMLVGLASLAFSKKK